jgi:hypothetical protein
MGILSKGPRRNEPHPGNSLLKVGRFSRRMAINCSREVQQFVCSVRLQSMGDADFRRSDKQSTKLIIQMNEALTNYGEQPNRAEFRKPVLQAITGQKLLDPKEGEPSQNMLSSRWHHILIEELQDVKSDVIIREIARLIEANPETKPWCVFPQEW